MNIALFDAAKFWSGGAERVYLCAVGFKQKGHDVVVVCLPTSRLNLLLKDKVKIYNVVPLFDLDFFAAFKIFLIILKNKIKILDIHSPKFYWIGVFVGKLLNCRVFITRNVEYRKKGLKKLVNRLLYRLCDGVITVSEKIKKNMTEDFEISEDKIRFIRDSYVIDTRLKENIKEKYKIPADAYVLSIIGRIEENKRQTLAIDLIKSLINKGYDCYLFIIGQTEDKRFYNLLTKKVINLNLEKRVIFTGYVTNVSDYIISSDLVICCSKHEGISKSVVESLLLKTPVVSTFNFEKESLPNTEELFVVSEDNFQRFVELVEKVLNRKRSFPPKLNVDKIEVGKEEMLSQYLDFYKSKI